MSDLKPMRLGDDVLSLGVWLWLTVSVGPWWLGVGLFVLAGLLNWIQRRVGL